MNKRSYGRRLMVGFFALSLMLAFAAPAIAHHAADHDQGQGADNAQGAAHSDSPNAQGSDHDGDADSNSNTLFTEDNDTNDGGTANNVVDSGDNAHPSGKDRSVENGNSASNPNQGKAESDPDNNGKGPDRSNGGPDKPNGSGGTDKADQDGNNGCGNDDDFEDDNEGRCGRRPARPPTPPTNPPGNPPSNPPANPPSNPPANPPTQQLCPAGTDHAGEPMTDLADCNDDEVGGLQLCPKGAYAGMPFINPEDCERDRVLGNVIRRDAPEDEVEGAILPFTGASLATFLAFAIALLSGGALILIKGREN